MKPEDQIAGLCVANAELGLMLLDYMARFDRLRAVAEAGAAISKALDKACCSCCLDPYENNEHTHLGEALAGLQPGDLDGPPKMATMQADAGADVARAAVETLDALAPVTGPAAPPFGERESVGLRDDLAALLNRYSVENGSDTPDYILAAHLLGELDLFDRTTSYREAWYGRRKRPVVADVRVTVDQPTPDDLIAETVPAKCEHKRQSWAGDMSVGTCLDCGVSLERDALNATRAPGPLSVVPIREAPRFGEQQESRRYERSEDGTPKCPGCGSSSYFGWPTAGERGITCARWCCNGGCGSLALVAPAPPVASEPGPIRPPSACPHLHTMSTADGAAEVCVACGQEVVSS